MATTYKISARKVIQALLTLVVTLGCVVAMVGASKVEGDTKNIKAVVDNTGAKRYHFLEDSEIYKKAITNRHVDLVNTPVSQLDLFAMEQALLKDDWIENAQVFLDNKKVLHIAVIQRVPVVRLFTQSGRSVFMDSTLHLMPISKFLFYTLAVTNVPDLGTDSLGMSIKFKLRKLVNAISRDSFWSAQVAEIVMDSATSFELIPIAGTHNIILGDTSDIDTKLANLYSFYLNVLNKVGWDRYKTIDVRFKGQLVASPSIPYTGKPDNFGKTWLTAMLEAEARKDSVLHAQEPKRTDYEPPARPAVRIVNSKPVDKKPIGKPVADTTKHNAAGKPLVHDDKSTAGKKDKSTSDSTKHRVNGKPVSTTPGAKPQAKPKPASTSVVAKDRAATAKPHAGSAANNTKGKPANTANANSGHKVPNDKQNHKPDDKHKPKAGDEHQPVKNKINDHK